MILNFQPYNKLGVFVQLYSANNYVCSSIWSYVIRQAERKFTDKPSAPVVLMCLAVLSNCMVSQTSRL